MDRWLSEGQADVSGETLTVLPGRQSFGLKTAVLFEKELTESGDPRGLLGKVKDLEQIAELGGDYSAGSVILGDEAYEVTEGFVGEPVATDDVVPALSSIGPSTSASFDASSGAASDLAAALSSATDGSAGGTGELDLLARFFLERS